MINNARMRTRSIKLVSSAQVDHVAHGSEREIAISKFGDEHDFLHSRFLEITGKLTVNVLVKTTMLRVLFDFEMRALRDKKDFLIDAVERWQHRAENGVFGAKMGCAIRFIEFFTFQG